MKKFRILILLVIYLLTPCITVAVENDADSEIIDLNTNEIILIPNKLITYLVPEAILCFNTQNAGSESCVKYFKNLIYGESDCNGVNNYIIKECIYREYFGEFTTEKLFASLFKLCKKSVCNSEKKSIEYETYLFGIKNNNNFVIFLNQLKAELQARYIRVGGRWVKWP